MLNIVTNSVTKKTIKHYPDYELHVTNLVFQLKSHIFTDSTQT